MRKSGPSYQRATGRPPQKLQTGNTLGRYQRLRVALKAREQRPGVRAEIGEDVDEP